MLNIQAGAKLAALFCAAILFTGCAAQRKTKPDTARPAKPAPAPTVKTSPEAQKKAYDAGLRYYSVEKYHEAREAWQNAVSFGPSTLLGKKAQEYLQKTEAILKTLEEIEKQ